MRLYLLTRYERDAESAKLLTSYGAPIPSLVPANPNHEVRECDECGAEFLGSKRAEVCKGCKEARARRLNTEAKRARRMAQKASGKRVAEVRHV